MSECWECDSKAPHPPRPRCVDNPWKAEQLLDIDGTHHIRGNEDCDEGGCKGKGADYPYRHECGGLMHMTWGYGPSPIAWCDKCDKGEP